MNRRELFAAGTAVAVVAVPAAAQAEPSRSAALFAERNRIVDRLNAECMNMTEGECDALHARACELERRIMEVRPGNRDDAATKLRLFIRIDEEGMIWHDAARGQLFRELLTALEAN